MPTIGLNIIVGPNEASELARCLESLDAKNTFDQVVICLTSKDEEVKKVAEKYTDCIPFFEWSTENHPAGDFSGARNTALDATKTDYVMWIDSDDVILDKHKDALSKLVNHVKKCDGKTEAFFIPYVLTTDIAGNPITSFLRDRIFKRIDKFRWWGSVHEQTTSEDWDKIVYATVKGMAITHMSMKPAFASANRNVKILLKQNEREHGRNPHTLHFLGQDLMLSGNHEAGIKIYEKMVSDIMGKPENLYIACMNVLYYYAYNGYEGFPTLGKMNMKNADNIENWARMAIAFSNRYAEPYVILADLYQNTGRVKNSARAYKIALEKVIGTGTLQSAPYYEEIPAMRLAELAIADGEWETALWYNSRAYKHRNDEIKQKQRKNIMQNIIRNDKISKGITYPN